MSSNPVNSPNMKLEVVVFNVSENMDVATLAKRRC
jgi:hypothetical protein